MRAKWAWWASAAVVLAGGPSAGASEAPLEAFERMMGGRWCLEGSCQTFEWGVGRRVVRARMTAPGPEGGERLVSEGQLYWHPGERVIKGVFVAVEMGVDLFEYDVRFEGDTLVGKLRAYGEGGGEFVETWDFDGADRFTWTLWSETDSGREKRMGGVFERTR